MASRQPSIERQRIQYPGGLAAHYRWTGSANAANLFALSETGGVLTDHGSIVTPEPDRLCRAELRVEGPLGAWTARFASTIYDVPRGVIWDDHGLLVVGYGFHVYGLVGRTGELQWTWNSGTPLVALIGSTRLPYLIAQTEIETVALRPDGDVVWRVAHSDVVTDARLAGGRLLLTSFAGASQLLDPTTGRSLPT